MPSRRTVLLGALGALALGVGGLGRTAAEAEIVRILRKKLPFLHLDNAGLQTFAREHVSSVLHKPLPTWKHIYTGFRTRNSSEFLRYRQSHDTRSRAEKFEDEIVFAYLLSSDFFTNGSNESLLVRYVAPFDPLRACGNPFARPPQGLDSFNKTA